MMSQDTSSICVSSGRRESYVRSSGSSIKDENIVIHPGFSTITNDSKVMFHRFLSGDKMHFLCGKLYYSLVSKSLCFRWSFVFLFIGSLRLGNKFDCCGLDGRKIPNQFYQFYPKFLSYVFRNF